MLTERIAGFVVGTRAIPGEALREACTGIGDAIACGLAGSLDESSIIARRWANEMRGPAQATVWGSALRTTAADAALANGTFVHALDYDDTLPTQRGHPSSTLVPVVLALGESTGASGRAVLEAYVLGLDVAGVIGRALGNGHYLRGWHPTATAGVFAATAAAGRLAGLDAAQLCQAWGLAATQASGHTRNFGTMTKPFHAGLAARSAVLSVWFAREGFTADAEIFEGRGNFFSTYAGEDGRPLAELVDELGKRWAILEPGINYKRWPCCSCNHRAIGGLLDMMEEHGITAADVRSVSVGFPPGADDALKYDDPQTGAEGKFSIQYSVAATLLDRRITLETYTDAMLHRPEARSLMGRVSRYRIEDRKTYSGTVGYTDVELVTGKGTYKRRIDRSPGSSEWPMSVAEHEEKFLDCAGRALGADGARRLFDRINGAADLASIGPIIEELRVMDR